MTTFSPVTETEMNEFFARITSTIREYSTLPDKLATVEGQLHDLSNRLADLQSQNEQLRRDNADATELAKAYEQERDRARSDFANEQSRASHLSDLIMARDSRVQELSKAWEEEKNKSAGLDRECSRLNDKCAHLEVDVDALKKARDYWKAEANTFQDRAMKAEEELKAIEEKLSALGFVKPKVEEPVKASDANPTASTQTSAGSPSQTAATATQVPSADWPSHPTSPEASPPSETSGQTTQESPDVTEWKDVTEEHRKPEMKPVIHEDNPEEQTSDGSSKAGEYRPFDVRAT